MKTLKAQRAAHTDFGMGDRSLKGGGEQGSDGGDWRVIRDKIISVLLQG